MTRLKVLFVTHVVTLGGASRSLRELVNAYEAVDAELAVPRFAGAPDDAAIRRFFGQRLGRIHRFWLPWSEVYVGHPAVWQSARSHLLFPLMWRAEQRRFGKFVERQKFDAVHLNSLVLHPMVSPDLPFTLHVREILTDRKHGVRRDAARTRGTVFIDVATKKPFEPSLPPHHVILNNPVDMTGVGEPPADIARRLGGDPASLTVFAMIGDLTDEKGVPFVIEVFRRARSSDVRLVLVGKSTPAMRSRLEQLADGDRRIVFWGEEREIAKLYTVADFVLRGEGYPCVGRTIYEALYAGCGVIIPGRREGHGMFELDRFGDRVHFYPPRDEDAFVAQIDALTGTKYSAKRGESNVPGYVAAFDRFLRRALARP
jgi:glycosyltransferase involved in cell wall biosynthesis